jgi:HK97 family phage portal protein
VKVVPGNDGWPEAWDYSVAGRTVRIVVPEARQQGGQPVPGMRPVLHMRLFHPDDDHYGMSPLEAAATSIDLHNTAARWNKALLDNSARPSGALVYTSRDGNLTTEQYERLKSELEAGFQGAGNAGRPLLLEGGLDWKAMSLSPKDMDFMEVRHTAAREIALALGVPPMLLGIPGDNSYSNMAEAQRIFWRQTVVPLIERFATALTNWLAPAYEPGLRFVIDTDALEPLSPERDASCRRRASNRVGPARKNLLPHRRREARPSCRRRARVVSATARKPTPCPAAARPGAAVFDDVETRFNPAQLR